MATQTTSLIEPAVQTYFDKRLLVRAKPATIHSKVAQRRMLPANSGDTVKFRRYERLGLATADLVEGITPTGRDLTKTDITSAIRQHGDYVKLTDKVQAIIQEPLLRETIDLLGQQAGETIDVLHREAYAAGTVVQYGGAVAGRANIQNTSQLITTTALDKAIRTLQQADAKRFTELIQGANKEQTYPIRPAYWAITSPEVQLTLENLTGFIPVEKYASQSKVDPNEIGAYKSIRFLCTTLSKSIPGGGGTATGVAATSSNADIHTILIFGQNAVGTVPYDKLSLSSIIKPLGSGGTSDPLNQVGTAGWKRAGTQLILNQAFMLRLEVAVLA